MVAAIMCVGLPLRGEATTVRGMSTQELVREAAVVVRARVLSRQSTWNEGKTRIYTDTILRVSEVVVGKLKKRDITLRQIGGVIGKLEMSVPGVAPIAVGEEVLVFARTDGTRYYLVGMAQGKYGVRTKAGKVTVTRELTGLKLLPNKTRVGPPPVRAKNRGAQPYHVFVSEIVGHAKALGR